MQLFQLPWTAIAEECEETLGPRGFAWVLTSPPQEHIDRDEWWASYQPVSYELETRLGTRDEFADMVQRCDDAGVAVIADAVINHMTGQDAAGTGCAGTPYEHYEYPGLFGVGDFHHCGLTPNDDIADYKSREQVQTCELVNLADLDTSSDVGADDHRRRTSRTCCRSASPASASTPRSTWPPTDVEAIVDALPDGTRIISEVIRGGGEPIQPEEYAGFGEVFEFTYARDLIPQVLSATLNDPDLADPRLGHVPRRRRRRLHRQPRHRARRGGPHLPRRRPLPHGERPHARRRLRHPGASTPATRSATATPARPPAPTDA